MRTHGREWKGRGGVEGRRRGGGVTLTVAILVLDRRAGGRERIHAWVGRARLDRSRDLCLGEECVGGREEGATTPPSQSVIRPI